ncbi:MAG: hypothetical protein ACXWWQ_03865 [Candidatus Limnocylindria bacterium]
MTHATPIAVRAAAVLLGVLGLAVFVYTVSMTVPLVLEPDPMFGLEMVVSAVLLVAAGGAVVVGVGLTRCAAWARPAAIGVALLLLSIAGTLPFITPTMVGAGPPPIHPVSWLLGATGLALLVLAVKPCPSG